MRKENHVNLTELVAQRPEQRHIRLDVQGVRFAVDLQSDSHGLSPDAFSPRPARRFVHLLGLATLPQPSARLHYSDTDTTVRADASDF